MLWKLIFHFDTGIGVDYMHPDLRNNYVSKSITTSYKVTPYTDRWYIPNESWILFVSDMKMKISGFLFLEC